MNVEVPAGLADAHLLGPCKQSDAEPVDDVIIAHGAGFSFRSRMSQEKSAPPPPSRGCSAHQPVARSPNP